MKLSVITVNYNNRDGLERTIKSVIGQVGFDDYEYIIIDGGSVDGSKELIEEYQDYFSFWCSEPDKGIYNAMNKAVVHALGDYCIFMNSGDIFYDSKVLYRVFIERDIKADYVAGNFFLCEKVRYAPDIITALTMFKVIEQSICHQALFTRRELLVCAPYNEDYKIISDFVNMFDSLILKNATYQHIDVIICDVEPNGLSAIDYQGLSQEKNTYLYSVLPNRIYDDYTKFMNIKLISNGYNELYNVLSQYNFSRTDMKITTAILKMFVWIKKIRQMLYI